MGERPWKPKPITPALERKIASCHCAEVEQALAIAFRKLRDEEEQREEERRDAIRRASRSPLGGLEPLIFSRTGRRSKT